MLWEEFILEHESDDLSRLVLSRDKYPGVDVPLAASTIECRRRLRDKVPQWYGHPGLILPLRLSAEQCSSTAAARYKASVARSCFPSGSFRMADLTGGLGVDSWAFSQVASEVLYNEAVPVLCDAARHNFAVLGADHIRIGCHKVGTDPLREVLGDFRPDLIFLDPARRGEGGRKVFLLEDCSPDVKALLPELFEAARFVLLKLSPMADISMLLERLPHTRQVHIVALKGECKELLLLLDRDFDGEPEMLAVEIPGGELDVNDGMDGVKVFRYERSEAARARAGWAVPEAGMLLFEPGKSLSKAGCFHLLSERSGLAMAGRNSHLYLQEDQVVPEASWAAMGKWFRIREILPLDKRGIALAAGTYPLADVSARGVPMSSDELARRLRTAGKKIPERVRNDKCEVRNVPVHLFAVHSDLLDHNLLLVAESLYQG